MRSSSAILTVVFLGGALAACDDNAPQGSSPSASVAASTTASAPTPKASLAPMDKPKPLELAALMKALSCSGKAGSGPCPVLEKFRECRDGWSPITQSGDGRWLGQGAVVKKGQFVDDFFVMRSRRVGTAEVAPGALGVKIAFEPIPEDESEARSAAAIAFRALDRGDVVKRGNRAMDYVTERDKWSEGYAQQADGHQIYLAAGAGGYLCGDPATQAVHVVRLSETREHPADGIYATLYPVKW